MNHGTRFKFQLHTLDNSSTPVSLYNWNVKAHLPYRRGVKTNNVKKHLYSKKCYIND